LRAIPDHGVENDDELAHAGDEANLARLPGEALGKDGDSGIVSRGHHGGHVECIANEHTSGLDALGADLSAGAAI